MTANQIPRAGGGLTHGMARDRSRHDCPDCLRNGGHHVVHDEETLPMWAQSAITHVEQATTAPVRRKCSYWSARAQEHCGETDKLRLHPGVGIRCATHDPDILNAQYWALIIDKES